MADDADIIANETAQRTLAAIGRRIRDTRKARGMTLQQLAEVSGISSSMLSLVERGLASPSIGSLIVIADALNETMSDLMATDPHTADLVVRAADIQPVTTNQNVVRRVMKEDRGRGISIALNEYAPNTGSNESPLSHDGYEYGLLLEGVLTVEIDGEIHKIGAGDLISYESRRPHRIFNHGERIARTVWINTDRR